MKIIGLIQETPGQGAWTQFWHPTPGNLSSQQPAPSPAAPSACGRDAVASGHRLRRLRADQGSSSRTNPGALLRSPRGGIMEVTVPAAGAGSGVLMELRRSNREGGPNDSRFSRAADKWPARVSGLAFSA